MVLQEPLTNISDAYQVFSKAVEQEQAEIRKVDRGTMLSFSDGVTLQILGPDSTFIAQENPQGVTEQDNPPSLIVHLTYHSFDLLLNGDSDGEDLELFVPVGFMSEVLQLPHHGSKNGYTASAAKKIIPEIAVISSGKNNSYGHPHKAVFNELQQHRSKIMRTDQIGHIHLIIDETGKISIPSGLSQ